MTVSILPHTYISELPASRLKDMAPSFEGTLKKSESSKLLVSSPYPGVTHQLDLSSVDETSRTLALALQQWRPIKDDYPSQSYVESFNWQEVIDLLPSDFSGILTSSTSDM
jgi:hypothetical protein